MTAADARDVPGSVSAQEPAPDRSWVTTETVREQPRKPKRPADEVQEIGDVPVARVRAAEAEREPADSLYAAALVALSEWVDAGNAHRDPEAITWGRLAKITEEAGEVVAAYIGATGQNPRKGVIATMDDVEAELLDVAVAALTALEHVRGHRGDALQMLDQKVLRTAARAGVVW